MLKLNTDVELLNHWKEILLLLPQWIHLNLMLLICWSRGDFTCRHPVRGNQNLLLTQPWYSSFTRMVADKIEIGQTQNQSIPKTKNYTAIDVLDSCGISNDCWHPMISKVVPDDLVLLKPRKGYTGYLLLSITSHLRKPSCRLSSHAAKIPYPSVDE
jgi:hypothetical protein